ncbi:MAG: GspE/PulE family protein [Desulfomicrobiaceae bacterium]
MTGVTGRRVVYSLGYLLDALVDAGLFDAESRRKVLERAVALGVDPAADGGLDFLLGLGIRLRSRGGEGMRLTEEQVLRAVGLREGVEVRRVSPLDVEFDPKARAVSESFARSNLLVPLGFQDGQLELLVHNPFRPELWSDMERVSPPPYRIALGVRSDIERLIDDFYGFRAALTAAEAQFSAGTDLGNLEARVQVAEKVDADSEQHVIKAVDYLLRSALRERASDIHLEPKREGGRIRFRIDGILHDVHRIPATVYAAMMNRLKGMSRLDISEKRRPQDGRVQLMLAGTPTDVRVSTIPVAFGEKMVLRLLSSHTTLKSPEELGMTPEQLALFTRFVRSTHGLILVTGPTGSGKSTTLYSTLKTLASPQVNIVTLEDPIEMVVDEFNQVGIQTRIGVTFGGMLRHLLRQDPDIIMVGEMRDLETAEQAVQAALTGHLVFSTLHTNDAASALTRLLDLGLAAYLINAAVIGIIAQRLVRVICPYCKESVPVDLAQMRVLGLERFFADTTLVWRGRGCEACRGTGFLGRQGIFEVLPLDTPLKDAVRRGVDLAELRAMVRAQGIPSLLEDGMARVVAGITTVDEVLRVAGSAED